MKPAWGNPLKAGGFDDAHRDSLVLPSLALLGSQISVNLGAAVAKHLFPVIGVEGITAFRVGFSALMLMAIFRPWRSPLTRRDIVNLLIYGTVMGMMNLLIYRAFERIPIGIAVAIEVTGPLLVALLSSRRPRNIASCALAAFGLYLLLPLNGGAGGSTRSASPMRSAPRHAGRCTSCSASARRPCAAARRWRGDAGGVAVHRAARRGVCARRRC